jgi:hypothetical protein
VTTDGSTLVTNREVPTVWWPDEEHQHQSSAANTRSLSASCMTAYYGKDRFAPWPVRARHPRTRGERLPQLATWNSSPQPIFSSPNDSGVSRSNRASCSWFSNRSICSFPASRSRDVRKAARVDRYLLPRRLLKLKTSKKRPVTVATAAPDKEIGPPRESKTR